MFFPHFFIEYAKDFESNSIYIKEFFNTCIDVKKTVGKYLHD